MSVLLHVKNLSAVRGGQLVLDAVTFDLEEGGITGLTGPNGGGKSTLLEVLLDGLKASGGSWNWTRPIDIAYLPQQLNLRKTLPISIGDFVEMGTWAHGKKASAALTLDESFDLLDLRSVLAKRISEVSGGQWKRALIARCLVQPADVYFLDEPFNHLDLKIEETLGHRLQELSRKNGKTFFIISHDWHAMDHFFDRLILLHQKILAVGSVREVSDVYMNWRDPRHHQWMHGDTRGD
jgi:iron/zinc/copper transport system ATP-binding protein